jgi:hypothetical protein
MLLHTARFVICLLSYNRLLRSNFLLSTADQAVSNEPIISPHSLQDAKLDDGLRFSLSQFAETAGFHELVLPI